MPLAALSSPFPHRAQHLFIRNSQLFLRDFDEFRGRDRGNLRLLEALQIARYDKVCLDPLRATRDEEVLEVGPIGGQPIKEVGRAWRRKSVPQ